MGISDHSPTDIAVQIEVQRIGNVRGLGGDSRDRRVHSAKISSVTRAGGLARVGRQRRDDAGTADEPDQA